MTQPLRAPEAPAITALHHPADVRAMSLALELIRVVSERLPAAAANDVRLDASARVELARAQSTVASLTEQLHALYRDRELLVRAFGSADAEEIAVRVLEREQNYIDQLNDNYAEREEIAAHIGTDGLEEAIRRDREVIEGLNAQLHALYAEREEAARRPDPRDEAIESLVAQLHGLYEEREHEALRHAPPAPAADPGAPEPRSALDEIRLRFFGH